MSSGCHCVTCPGFGHKHKILWNIAKPYNLQPLIFLMQLSQQILRFKIRACLQLYQSWVLYEFQKEEFRIFCEHTQPSALLGYGLRNIKNYEKTNECWHRETLRFSGINFRINNRTQKARQTKAKKKTTQHTKENKQKTANKENSRMYYAQWRYF